MSLPTLPPGLPAGLQLYLRALSDAFSVTQSDLGSPLKSKPTIQDLIDIGVIQAAGAQQLQVNGKTFTLDNASSWLSSPVPTWFSDSGLPPPPAGLQVFLSKSNFLLAWQAISSNLYLQTMIYRSATNDLSTAVNIGSTTGNTYVDNLPASGTYYYWLRNQAKSTLLSDYNSLIGSTVGNVVGGPAMSYAFDTTDLLLSWPTPTSALTIKYYIVRYGASFAGGVDVGTSNTNTLRITAAFGGTRRFWCAGVDVNDQVGTPSFIDVTVAAPSSPTVAQTIQNDALVLTYQAAAGSLPVGSYELRFGTSWAAGLTVAIGSQTRFETKVNWQGNRSFFITAYDTAGNASVATQSDFIPVLPSPVVIGAQVIDNNVLLRWTTSSGTLTIASYIVDKGGVAIGSISGIFSVSYETVSGTYTYGVTPVDSAGNMGTRATISAVVAQPPDFVLYSNVNSTFTGAGVTLTQTAVDAGSGSLICNVDTTETWATHFSSRGWTNINDQVAAGYTQYVVGKTTGSFVEALNYGVSIPSTKITMAPNVAVTTGSMGITGTIETSTNGTTWGTPAVGFSVYGTSFQYVRYTLNFAATHTGTGLATDTAALVFINPLNYVLAVKLKTYQVMVSALSTDSSGTPVDITGQFIDVQAIAVSPLGTTPLFCVYDFVDIPNPTVLKVYVFNSSGTRVSATVSVTVRGV